MAERTAWTDERIDDKMLNMDSAIERLETSLREFRAEMKEEFRVLHGDLHRLDDRLDGFQDRLIQIGFGLALAVFAALVTAILAVT